MVNAYKLYYYNSAQGEMMNYTICEMDSFSVIGQKIELTNRQKENIKICVEFWREFNNNLKKAYLLQSGNWIKYAFMERREDRLFYYCAIPRKIVVPEGFVSKEIASCKYMVVEHIGSMDKIYETYTKIYKEILPNTEHTPLRESFLHFERYDARFHWNRDNSIIEVWVPIGS